MKRKLKQRLKRLGKMTVTVLLLVALNINPIAMISTIILDSGIVSRFSNLGKNLTYLAGQKIDAVLATEDFPSFPSLNPLGSTDVSIVDTPSSYFSTTESYLNWIMQYSSTLGNTEDDGSLYSIIRELYDIGSGYSESTKIDADHPSYSGYGKALSVHDEAMTARLLGVNERDLSHVNAAQLELLAQMGYDPRWVNENGNIEEDLDKLIRSTHEYSVANVYSLNNMIGGALWRPYSDEIPYIREFAEIVGGFANVYMGYWDTNVSTLKQPINSQRALEVLGYDAILRYEGIQVLESSKILENGVEAIFVPDVVGLNKYTESPVQRDIVDDPDTHEEDIPDRNLTPSGLAGVPTGQSGVNENIILRQVEVSEDGIPFYVPEDEIESAIIPDSTIIQLYQEEIPNQDITWLDAVTVLYKALDKEQISYQTFTAYNPNITPETSPLSRELPGLTSFDGYNFYAFFTRANPYQGDLETGSFQAIYWRKAVNDGFVSYALRDQVISAEDFYMLAQRMMEAYGEPEMSKDEMHTLLQIYGSYYPVQLGRTVADAWEYLKCRGILTGDNEPDGFTSSLTRDQLLDICMRIKDKDSRITYKNMNLVIDVGDVLRDKDYFPVYDFDMKTDEDDEFTFISTTVDYEAFDYYTYMFPIERAVNLGYSGCGLIYNAPEKSDENLINGALYEGKKHIEGYDYYVINVPQDYAGPIFFGFQNYDDPGSVKGTVDFIEVPNYCLGGGIYTAYEITEQDGFNIATLVKPQDGVSYFPFSSQSNNMDLVYYCDFDRLGVERPVGYESASIASAWDKIVDTWNYLTQPMEVHATEINADIEQTDGSGNSLPVDSEGNIDSNYKATIITKVASNKDYWTDAGSTYGDGNNEISLVSGKLGAKQVAPNAPGWFSCLARSSLLSISGLGVWYQDTAGNIELSSFGLSMSKYYNNDINEVSSVEAGDSIVSTIALHSSSTPCYSELVQVQKDQKRKTLIAFAAGIHPSNIGFIDGSQDGPDGVMDEDIIKAMSYLKSQNYGWLNHLGKFQSVSKESQYSSKFSKAVTTQYKYTSGGYFEILSIGYKASDILDFLGKANKSGTESGIIGGGGTDLDMIRTSLNTSVIMDKDHQILLCWDDLVKSNFAWGITDGKPKLSDDGTYTFMTRNGMVKVSDDLHIIQIGSTLYTWPDDGTAPNLVYIDNDGNMYMDIRCVTGVINVECVPNGKKTEIFNKCYGAGSYAVYSISAHGADTSIYKTKGVGCYNFPDTQKTGGAGIASGSVFPVSMNTLDITRFDGVELDSGDTYWGEDVDGMRILLSDFNPTANWILTTTYDDDEIFGKLYVYYLKDAFTFGITYSDGGSPPVATNEWIAYWEKQIEVNKKRCDANYPELAAQVKDVMQKYSETVDQGWISTMTEAAMYSIAADTGYFYLSSDYAVRCFDLTTNSIVTQPLMTDFSEHEVDAVYDDDFRGNDGGSAYFMEYAGFVYNLPSYEDFNLHDYLSGKYPLPLVKYNDREIWNMNMTWYGSTHDGVDIPYGYELTSDGFINYKDFSDVLVAGDSLPQRRDADKNLISDQSEITENTNLPFYVPPEGSQDNQTFKPAPVAIFARYGLLDSGVGATKVGVLSQNETMRNYYYLGNRIVCISKDFTSRNAKRIPFDFASTTFNPIALNSVDEAHFVGQVRRPISRSYYVLPYSNIYEVDSAILSNSQEEHLSTDDSYLWDNRPKLTAILNMIDRSTNWLMWAVFILAPMICVIVMTVLIGLSFITDNKVYLAFCEKFFDPVRFLTLGMKDSNHWVWREVWRRATIVYIAFALFANANILRIVIWAVDGWMRITEALGF